MSAMASLIIGVSIVYPNVCPGADQMKRQSSVLLAFVMGNSPVTGEFPAQKASKAENVFIWWRHHVGGLQPYCQTRRIHVLPLLIFGG